jgi:hypothetical protein
MPISAERFSTSTKLIPPTLVIIRFIVKGLQRVPFEIYLEVLDYVDKSSACESRE